MSFPPTRFFYAGSPNAILSLHPSVEGVGVSITWPCDDTKPSAGLVMSPEGFAQLLTTLGEALAAARVGLTIAVPDEDGKPGTSCVMSPESLDELLTDGPVVLAAVKNA